MSGGQAGQSWRTTLIHALNAKILEMVYRLADLKNDENGQTSAEYVAVTAVAVAIAITVIYATMETALSNAVSEIATNITEFIENPA